MVLLRSAARYKIHMNCILYEATADSNRAERSRRRPGRRRIRRTEPRLAAAPPRLPALLPRCRVVRRAGDPALGGGAGRRSRIQSRGEPGPLACPRDAVRLRGRGHHRVPADGGQGLDRDGHAAGVRARRAGIDLARRARRCAGRALSGVRGARRAAAAGRRRDPCGRPGAGRQPPEPAAGADPAAAGGCERSVPPRDAGLDRRGAGARPCTRASA